MNFLTPNFLLLPFFFSQISLKLLQKFLMSVCGLLKHGQISGVLWVLNNLPDKPLEHSSTHALISQLPNHFVHSPDNKTAIIQPTTHPL